MSLKALTLYVILKRKKTAKQVLEYCDKTDKCSGNDAASRVLLEIAGYKASLKYGFKYRDLFKELVKLGLFNNSTNDTMTIDISTIIQISPGLKKVIARHGSPEMHEFMLKNSFDVKKEFPGVIVTPLPNYSTKLVSSRLTSTI
jgi:hypothetical protein